MEKCPADRLPSIQIRHSTEAKCDVGPQCLIIDLFFEWHCFVSAILEMIGRGWDNFLVRPNGVLSLRFLIQPTIAGLLALRAGILDARQGRRGYLWALLTVRQRRFQLLHEGRRGARTPFLIAIALDCVYQLMTVQCIYPLELLFTATLLALVPYALLRGPFNRLARLFLPATGPPPMESSSQP
jgi:hypothetical protein